LQVLVCGKAHAVATRVGCQYAQGETPREACVFRALVGLLPGTKVRGTEGKSLTAARRYRRIR